MNKLLVVLWVGLFHSNTVKYQSLLQYLGCYEIYQAMFCGTISVNWICHGIPVEFQDVSSLFYTVVIKVKIYYWAIIFCLQASYVLFSVVILKVCPFLLYCSHCIYNISFKIRFGYHGIKLAKRNQVITVSSVVTK